jgi:hypothetical protein
VRRVIARLIVPIVRVVQVHAERHNQVPARGINSVSDSARELQCGDCENRPRETAGGERSRRFLLVDQQAPRPLPRVPEPGFVMDVFLMVAFGGFTRSLGLPP